MHKTEHMITFKTIFKHFYSYLSEENKSLILQIPNLLFNNRKHDEILDTVPLILIELG